MHFIQCSNNNCKSFFGFDDKITGGEKYICPRCRGKFSTHHIVQCEKCQTVVELIPIHLDEYPVLLSTKSCSNCKTDQPRFRSGITEYRMEKYI